jgi:EAL and modified HD-GYP domain-containing signal transduction protein
MEGIVEKLPINENIKAALCGDENELEKFLALIRVFESAYCKGVTNISNNYHST